MPKRTVKMTAVMLFALGSTPLCADALIVRATGPSAAKYLAGKSVSSKAQIVLKSGDQLTLLDSKGTRTLSGPGTFSPSGSSGGDKSSTLAALINNAGSRQVRTGAIRGDTSSDGPPHPSSIWSLDVAQSGTMCTNDLSKISLWRQNNDAATTMIVSSSSGEGSAQARWRAGQSTTLLSAAGLAIKNGASYKFQLAGQVPTLVTIKLVSPTSSTPSDVARAFISNGCTTQLNQLIAAGQ